MELYPKKRRSERTLLIDADDTLWENNVFYLRCTNHFLDYLESLGCERHTAMEMLQVCQQEMIGPYGYGPKGFVAALGLTCERSFPQNSNDPTVAKRVAKVRSLGEPVLSAPMVVLAGVESTLVALRPSTQLVLVTKGDEATQRAKIEKSGLGPLFDARYIVPDKNAHTYRSVASELGLSHRRTWMVGNSPKSDINPAIEAGLGAIYIPHNHTWTAELEEIEHPELVVPLQRFADLLPLFGIEALAPISEESQTSQR